MKAQRKTQSVCDVKIYSDKGSLALRFPLRHNAFWEQLDGKSLGHKPKCLGIGKYGFSADEPDDWKRATQIAIAMESDLDHPEWEKLFDRTLAKYGLGGGKYAKLADVLQMPGSVQAEPEITVGQMWEDYLVWKRTVVEETTFKETFTTLSNVVNGKTWNKQTRQHQQSEEVLAKLRLDEKGRIGIVLSKVTIFHKAYFIRELSQAYDYARQTGMIKSPTTENPFAVDKFSTPIVTTQEKYAPKVVNGEEVQWHEVEDEKALESDRRAFSREERDIIIEAFYGSTKSGNQQCGELIEFYFLTGCRTSEAFPLTWRDIDFEKNLIRFSKSLGRSTQKVKETKTGEARLFYFGGGSRLRELLLEIRAKNSSTLVFPNTRNGYMSSATVRNNWLGKTQHQTLSDGSKVKYYYPGVITRLVEDGKISQYLSPYHTRHTYITLTAWANAHNNNALLHIATACGNSVDVILRHYLGTDESVEIVEV
ncbi:MAG: tyrosine-type recombinase/integrase [Microcoleus sp.]